MSFCFFFIFPGRAKKNPKNQFSCGKENLILVSETMEFFRSPSHPAASDCCLILAVLIRQSAHDCICGPFKYQ